MDIQDRQLIQKNWMGLLETIYIPPLFLPLFFTGSFSCYLKTDIKDRQLIQKKWMGLLETIHIPPLLPHLIESNIFTDSMIKEFTIPTQSHSEQKQKLLELVTKRGPNAKMKFVECLVAAGFYDAARLLQNDIQIPAPMQRSEFKGSSPIEEVKVIKAVSYYGGLHNLDLNCDFLPRYQESRGYHIIQPYRMISNPRGIALIFINKKFVNDIYSFRNGADVDGRYLNELFTGLGYNVVIHFNKYEVETWTILQEWQNNPMLKTVDSLVIAFSSHGDPGMILAADGGKISEGKLYEMFNNQNCPFMKEKPKIFLIQACRGATHDDGVECHVATDGKPTSGAEGTVFSEITKPYWPTWTDMLIVHSTIPGYVSSRDKISGSWFFEIFTRVVMENAWNMHLHDMLLKVTEDLNWKCSSDGNKQTPELYQRGLTKHLYFNPGL